MLNKRGPGQRVIVVAAASRVSGQAVVEEGFHGFAETDAATGVRYALDISQSEHEVTFIATSAKGNIVDINETTHALTVRTRATAGAAGTRPFGIVAAVPGNGLHDDVDREPKTGKMWVITLPQA